MADNAGRAAGASEAIRAVGNPRAARPPVGNPTDGSGSPRSDSQHAARSPRTGAYGRRARKGGVGMEKLREYLQGMDFKKRAIGGLDEEDVLSHIKKICDLVQEAMDERDKSFEETTRKMQEAMDERNKALEETSRKMQAELDAAREKLKRYRRAYEELKEINEDLDRRIKAMRSEAERYGKARDEADRMQQEYDLKCQELMGVVEVLNNVKEDTEIKTRREMQEKLAEEQERARSAMLEEVEIERKAANREIDQVKEEIAELRVQKKAMREELAEEQERARSAMLAEIELERKAANREIDQVRDELADLRTQRQDMQESLRKKREQWKQHLEWIDHSLDMEKEEAGTWKPSPSSWAAIG